MVRIFRHVTKHSLSMVLMVAGVFLLSACNSSSRTDGLSSVIAKLDTAHITLNIEAAEVFEFGRGHLGQWIDQTYHKFKETVQLASDGKSFHSHGDGQIVSDRTGVARGAAIGIIMVISLILFSSMETIRHLMTLCLSFKEMILSSRRGSLIELLKK